MKKKPIKKEKAISVDKPAKKGFSLGFASNQIFKEMVYSGKVKFYAMYQTNVWLADKQGQFKVVKKPKRFYEMAWHTVPEALIKQFQKEVSLFDCKKITWAVILPVNTEAQIQKYLSKYAGGELLIQLDGRILRKGEQND